MMPSDPFEQAAHHAYHHGWSLIQQYRWAEAQMSIQTALTNYIHFLQRIGEQHHDQLYRRIGECGICISECLRFQQHPTWWEPLMQLYGYLQHACHLNPASIENRQALDYATNLWSIAAQQAAAIQTSLPQPIGGDEDQDGFSRSRAFYLCQAAKAAYTPNNLRADCYKFAVPDGGGIAGFICDTGQEIIVAFRGSTMPRSDHGLTQWEAVLHDWLDVNGNIEQIEGYGGRVHGGFAHIADVCWSNVSEFVQQRYHGQTLWLAGHSMGDAVATLVACRFWNIGIYPGGVYTFGAPKVGDRQFWSHYQPKLYNIVNRNDPIPQLPSNMSGTLTIPGGDNVPEETIEIDVEYESGGILRWIDGDKNIHRPTIGMEFNRFFSGFALFPIQDHALERYLNAIES